MQKPINSKELKIRNRNPETLLIGNEILCYGLEKENKGKSSVESWA